VLDQAEEVLGDGLWLLLVHVVLLGNRAQRASC
jgi:hypothetical protein